MRGHAKDELAERIFKLVADQVLEYEKEFDIAVQWHCDLKLNGKDYFDFKSGSKHYLAY
jgi:hypothetical protein